jgi:outer membrane protein TolC
MFRESILPKAKEALDLTSTDYQGGTSDYITLITAWREVLQIELQVAQVESDLGKSLASLERAVGAQLNEHPPAPNSAELPQPEAAPVPPAPPAGVSPFRQREEPEPKK